jgi:hypothetical protein
LFVPERVIALIAPPAMIILHHEQPPGNCSIASIEIGLTPVWPPLVPFAAKPKRHYLQLHQYKLHWICCFVHHNRQTSSPLNAWGVNLAKSDMFLIKRWQCFNLIRVNNRCAPVLWELKVLSLEPLTITFNWFDSSAKLIF